jgi:hypothetical protein
MNSPSALADSLRSLSAKNGVQPRRYPAGPRPAQVQKDRIRKADFRVVALRHHRRITSLEGRVELVDQILGIVCCVHRVHLLPTTVYIPKNEAAP